MSEPTFRDLCERLQAQRPEMSPSKVKREMARMLATEKQAKHPVTTSAPNHRHLTEWIDSTARDAIRNITREKEGPAWTL